VSNQKGSGRGGETKIVGCDLQAKQQAIAMVDSDTGEFIEKTLVPEGYAVREFYTALEGPVIVVAFEQDHV
jgi:hypothetical protein